jgi:hypothetical protein
MATKYFTTKVCVVCGKPYQPTSGTQRYCSGCIPLSKKKCHAMWNMEHRKGQALRICLRCEQQYRPTSSHQKYCLECIPIVRVEVSKAHITEWNKNNVEKRRVSHREDKAKRRVLGFIPLNKPFDGCNGHHLDKDHVLHIPKKLNQSIAHNVRTGKNMEKINTLGVQWWMSQVMRTKHILLNVGG